MSAPSSKTARRPRSVPEKENGGCLAAHRHSLVRAVGQLYDDFEHKDQRTRVVAYADAMSALAMQQPADTEALRMTPLAGRLDVERKDHP